MTNEQIAKQLAKRYPYSPDDLLLIHDLHSKSWDEIVLACKYARDHELSPAYFLVRIIEIITNKQCRCDECLKMMADVQ